MKIGFIYNAQCNIFTVLQQPQDDAAAALIYLATQLVKLGHSITIFSQTPNMPDVCNIRYRNIGIKDNTLLLDPSILETDFNALIVKNETAEFAVYIKNSLPYKPKMYLWTAHDYNSVLNKGLTKPEIISHLDGIICVSQWQRQRIADNLSIKQEKLHVLNYAISPFFEDLFIDSKEFMATKSKLPLLAFIGDPQDGLKIALDYFPNITANYPDVSFDIFTALQQEGTDKDRDTQLVNQIQQTKGAKYLGALNKVQSAALLRQHTILAYPGLIVQTSNVMLLEAMAAGLYVISSMVGANENYCAERGKTVDVELLDSDSLNSFISETLTICQTQLHSDVAFYDYCYKQSVEINKKHTWRMRAREWIQLLQPLAYQS